ncbi:MAG: pyruvate ferredoxin oxidoreductase [Bacteroidaceae bacterium]|nr:pyruvate ferredoxin oxidoreductase [Bacteroidaceae bacterium]
MDYKYIEQLLERYWECQTTLEEEAILRTFFRQEDVPASLLPYRQLFIEEDKMANEHLGKDFQDKILRMVDEEEPASSLPEGGPVVCKARRMTVIHRLRPFYRAAGLIAIMLSIGNAAHQSFTDEEDAAKTPQMAETIPFDSLQDISIGQPEEQSAALATQIPDTLDAFTR